jgi:hypothetical protein
MALNQTVIDSILGAKSRWHSNEISDSEFSDIIAKCLNWDIDNYVVSDSERGGIVVTRGCIENQPAIIFVTSGAYSIGELVNISAGYAYQADIEWGLVAGVDKLVLFNSRWLKFGRWSNEWCSFGCARQ